MPDYFIINLIIGLLAGVLAGMFGIGGGVVIVPALIVFAGLTLKQANGTSLAALLLPVAILGVISYYRAGLISIRISAYVACGLIVGVIFGSMVALSMPTDILRFVYGLFLLYVSWTFMKPVQLWQQYILKHGIDAKAPAPERSDGHYKFYFFIVIGILAGILSGLFGIGGGLVIVPALITFLKYDPKKAVGTSLGALLLPVGFPGVILYYNAGQLNLWYAAPVALGLLMGAVVGARITISLPSLAVKRIYSVFLLVMSIYFIVQSL